ncbi:hypothetical protein [Kitasatospora sp. A2-31]|uniref:hypothetical protein n=1 Tax=Kitasatospora sp. A2-31 TaxID=2916414 RepID=UPI001EEAA7A9|nr:hypothetical protein [Kitasatospora sp. A2-31]MCG6495534.1 hypothetical protein [Kitasatospora sp. A2-31]
MTPVHDGVYAIAKPDEQLLTLQAAKEFVVLLPPTGEVGEQDWEVSGVANGNVVIKNLRHGSYIGLDGPVEVNQQVRGTPEPFEWALRQAAERFTFHIVVPGGPVEGRELALDLSVLDIFPQRTALRPLEERDQAQAWLFQFRE